MTVENASTNTEHTSSGVGADVNNLGDLYLDGASTIADADPPAPG